MVLVKSEKQENEEWSQTVFECMVIQSAEQRKTGAIGGVNTEVEQIQQF